jgi:hypothetical protein
MKVRTGAVLAGLGTGLILFAFWRSSPGAARSRIIRIATGEVGAPDYEKYWLDVLPGQSGGFPNDWCGAFALWALHQAGVGTDVEWEIGRGFAYRLPMTNTPKPGDIAYFDQPYQHHSLVMDLTGDTLTTVDGNQAHDTVKIVKRDPRNVSAFFSIEPLLT